MLYADAGKERFLPEAATTEHSRSCVYEAKGEDSLDGSGNEAERERVRVVFLPRLDVKGRERYTNVSYVPSRMGPTHRQRA